MIVYEDGGVVVELPVAGALPGHIIIRPRQPVKFLSELGDDLLEYLFIAASMASTAVFEGLGAQGSNILVHEGDSLVVHVLPRSAGDGIDLFWNAERADPSGLERVAGVVKEAFWYVGKEAAPAQPVAVPGAPPGPAPSMPAPDSKPAVDYKLEHLRRSP